jgi:hypothetical protein
MVKSQFPYIYQHAEVVIVTPDKTLDYFVKQMSTCIDDSGDNFNWSNRLFFIKNIINYNIS